MNEAERRNVYEYLRHDPFLLKMVSCTTDGDEWIGVINGEVVKYVSLLLSENFI